MPNQVVLVADHAGRGFLDSLPAIVADSQAELTFSVVEDVLAEALAGGTGALEAIEVLPLIYVRKSALALRDDDFLLAFADRPLRSTPHGVGNLFLAGSNLAERPPRVGIVSTTFMRRNVVRPDSMYLTQRHALYHLVVCGVLGAFLDMGPHPDRGCLLDFNNYLPDIQRKIDVGYSFCDPCASRVRAHEYGDAVFRICSALRARGSLDVAGIRRPLVFDFRRLNASGHRSQAEAFEALCAELYARSSGPGDVTHLAAPDGGVDILLRRSGQTFAIQCKFFVDDFGPSQLRQIGESYRSAITKHDSLAGYFVALPILLNRKQRDAVLALALPSGSPISILDRDALVPMISREADIARRYFG